MAMLPRDHAHVLHFWRPRVRAIGRTWYGLVWLEDATNVNSVHLVGVTYQSVAGTIVPRSIHTYPHLGHPPATPRVTQQAAYVLVEDKVQRLTAAHNRHGPYTEVTLAAAEEIAFETIVRQSARFRVWPPPSRRAQEYAVVTFTHT